MDDCPPNHFLAWNPDLISSKPTKNISSVTAAEEILICTPYASRK